MVFDVDLVAPAVPSATLGASETILFGAWEHAKISVKLTEKSTVYAH